MQFYYRCEPGVFRSQFPDLALSFRPSISSGLLWILASSKTEIIRDKGFSSYLVHSLSRTLKAQDNSLFRELVNKSLLLHSSGKADVLLRVLGCVSAPGRMAELGASENLQGTYRACPKSTSVMLCILLTQSSERPSCMVRTLLCLQPRLAVFL